MLAILPEVLTETLPATRSDRESLTVKPTAAALRYYEREIFRENRFLGLPNGIAATGPAILMTLTCLRLSMGLADVLLWMLPTASYLLAYSILVSHLPGRGELKALAIEALYEEMSYKVEQLELCFDENEWRIEGMESEIGQLELSIAAHPLPSVREFA